MEGQRGTPPRHPLTCGRVHYNPWPMPLPARKGEKDELIWPAPQSRDLAYLILAYKADSVIRAFSWRGARGE